MNNNNVDSHQFSEDFINEVAILKTCVDGACFFFIDDSSIEGERISQGLVTQMSKVMDMCEFLHNSILHKTEDFEKRKKARIEVFREQMEREHGIELARTKEIREKYICENV